ncbi:hypothetical protein CFIO01_01035 [Colletotrichum fioriniae PJ7]|uniref:Uncharacterized protein n=1 Tax=Colletotrichum fioriniae PJ7 TaxID=1445577 RepID=A0A010S9H7_9PEZI|nr:hypothetical protein CFIO01_01035 [Colletotrichum fioriniae PJ7]
MDSHWALTEEWSKEQGNFTIWDQASDDAEAEFIYITPTTENDASLEKDSAVSGIGRRQELEPGVSPEQADFDDVKRPYRCDESNLAPVEVCKILLWEVQPALARYTTKKKPRRYCLDHEKGKCCIGHRIGPAQRANIRQGTFPRLGEALTKLIYFCTNTNRMNGMTSGECRVTVYGIDGTAWVDNGFIADPVKDT